MYRRDWLQMHRNIPASASIVLELKVCVTIPGCKTYYLRTIKHYLIANTVMHNFFCFWLTFLRDLKNYFSPEDLSSKKITFCNLKSVRISLCFSCVYHVFILISLYYLSFRVIFKDTVSYSIFLFNIIYHSQKLVSALLVSYACFYL